MSEVVWHDVECGPYTLDVSTWIALAEEAPPGVLDVAAGTGRTALPLARAGFDVTALDIEAELLAALEARATDAGLAIETVTADAQTFDLGRRFGAVFIPQSSIHLFPDRPAALDRVRAHLHEDGLAAIAFTPEFHYYEGPFLPEADELAAPDGSAYVSQAVALRDLGDRVSIDRMRWTTGPDGERTTAAYSIELRKLTLDVLCAEAADAGLGFERVLDTEEDPEYTPAQIAVFRP